MGGRTQADVDAIKSMGAGLKKVKKAFDGISNLDDTYGDAFGSGDLTDKFDEFASNWDISREKLTEEVDALAKIATAEGFSKWIS